MTSGVFSQTFVRFHTMSLKARITDDMKAAMRAKETEQIGRAHV